MYSFCVFQLSQTLPDYQNGLETKLNVIRNLIDGSEDLYRWTERVRIGAATMNPCVSPKITRGKKSESNFEQPSSDIKNLERELEEKAATYETLDSTYWVLAHDAESKGLTVDATLKVSSPIPISLTLHVYVCHSIECEDYSINDSCCTVNETCFPDYLYLH